MSLAATAPKVRESRSLGADQIIDYTQENFTENVQTYDVIFDTIGKSPFSGSMRSLREGGIYIQANPSMSDLVRGPLASRRSSKRVILKFASENAEGLAFLAGLLEDGMLVTVIDRSYPLEEIAEAHRYVELGHKAGNVIITVEHNGES